jgi:hypothetical protein
MTHDDQSDSYVVERGSRSTSLDSIIATGMDVQGFEAMGIPYVPFWGWFAKGLVDEERTLAWAYIDDFTVDYAFTTIINGAAFALLFQRTKPPTKRDKDKYERLVERDGLHLTGWRDLNGGAAPHQSLSNPVLFKNNMIVAGTLAGVMEPVLNFGMLGAMVGGKIAATAVTDKGAAYDEFKRLTSFFRPSLRIKRVIDRMPLPARRAFWGLAVMGMSRSSPEARNRAMRFVPGYGNIK